MTARKRLDIAPHIPTAEEAGVPGFQLSVWHGLWVLKGTPKSAIATLNAAVMAARADAAAKKRLADLSQDVPSPEEQKQTPEGLNRFPKGRNREMVADHQGGQYQGRMIILPPTIGAIVRSERYLPPAVQRLIDILKIRIIFSSKSTTK